MHNFTSTRNNLYIFYRKLSYNFFYKIYFIKNYFSEIKKSNSPPPSKKLLEVRRSYNNK